MSEQTILGLELGSTRIKATAIDGRYQPVSSGDYTWKSTFENGIWTYGLDHVWTGLKAAISGVANRERIAAMGVSAMMHGYLVFDKDWNLLVPFRTWQNTITAQAAGELTEAFHFNIPQRWSIAHLYQAVLNGEAHVPQIAHMTTLAGYVHYMLTGVNALGVGEASGMFPIDSETGDYDAAMLAKFNEILASRHLPWRLDDLLPKVLTAGEKAGELTPEGAKRLDGLLAPGIPFAPAEGDAGTGMTATNAVAPRTGNVSAGTSIFSMVVLEKPLEKVYQEIDLVTTPTGRPVAMVHCNNCTNDTNAWVSVLGETARLFGAAPSTGELYTRLYEKSLEGDHGLRRAAGVQLHGRGGRDPHGCRAALGDPETREQIHTGQLLPGTALLHHVHAEDRHGYSGEGAGGHRLSDGSRRPLQDPCGGPEIHGCRLRCPCDLHGDRRRGRPLRHGIACRLYAGKGRRRDPGGLPEHPCFCRCQRRYPGPGESGCGGLP